MKEDAEDRASSFDHFAVGCIPKAAADNTDTLPDRPRDRLLTIRNFKVSLETLVRKVKLPSLTAIGRLGEDDSREV